MMPSRRQVSIMVVLVLWVVVCHVLLLSRWDLVVSFFSAKINFTMFLKMVQHSKETARTYPLHTEKKKTVDSSLNGTRLQTDSLPFQRDKLVLRVDSLGDGLNAMSVTNMSSSSGMVVRQGRVMGKISTAGLGRQGGWAHLNKLIQKGNLDYSGVARYPLEDEYLTTMDREILADEPVKDLSMVASAGTSQLELLNPKGMKAVHVGDNITVQILVKDAKGRPVLKGGHQVRVWVVAKEKKTHRFAAVDVTDLRNGTYVTSVPILWPGRFEVRAALQRPREFHRMELSLMKIMTQIVVSFVSGTTEEVTLCNVIPAIPGYQEVCNLTSLNSGLPWYCGRPSSPGLECQHWSWSSRVNFPNRYPLTATENTLLNRFISEKAPCIRKLNQTIVLTAIQDSQKKTQTDKKTCQPLKPQDTWDDRAPRGYWEESVWHPLRGCPLPMLNTAAIFKCFHNTSVITLGDSNAGKVANGLQGYTHCVKQNKHFDKKHTGAHHEPFTYHCLKEKLLISWYPHAYPFYAGIKKWDASRVKSAPSVILNGLPASGKFVILIHLYAHFSQIHPHVYTQHIRDTARAVRDLINRNSDVKVFIRGPHAGGLPMFPLGDFHPERCLRVLRNEFGDLKERVVLLNTWDMTVANENCQVHPREEVVTTLLQMILSHVCPDSS